MNDEIDNTALINSLIQHLKNKDPYLYNSLPELMQKDKRIAKAAINGGIRFIKKRNEYDGVVKYLYNDGVGKYGFYDDNDNFCNENYQKHRNLIKNICVNQPNALTSERLAENTYFRIFLQAINDVDSSFYSTTILPHLDKMGVHDSSYRLEALFCIWDLLHAGQLLNEQHYIIISIVQNNDLRGTKLRLEDIPERFDRARTIHAYVDRIPFMEPFSLPPELVTDKEFCLSCLRVSFRSYDMSYNQSFQIWNSIPENIRSDEKFLSESVLRNRMVIYICWSSMEGELPFKVWLSAIKAHGYKRVIFCTIMTRHLGDSIAAHLIGTFYPTMISELDRYEQFLVFASGLVQSRRGDGSCRCTALRHIDFFGDSATSTALKKHIASYVGVPTGHYLADLREVSNLADLREISILRDQLQGLQGGRPPRRQLGQAPRRRQRRRQR